MHPKIPLFQRCGAGPEGHGWGVSIMKKNVAGGGICGCITSLKLFENMMTKMSHFGGYVWLFWGSDGGLRALSEEITPP